MGRIFKIIPKSSHWVSVVRGQDDVVFSNNVTLTMAFFQEVSYGTFNDYVDKKKW